VEFNAWQPADLDPAMAVLAPTTVQYAYMLKKTILFATFSVFALIQCTTKKNIVATETPQEWGEVLPTKAHLKGIILQQSPQEGCPYLIQMEGSPAYFLDPVNLPPEFAQDKKEVYFTFRGLRQMNRCKGNPIWILDMVPK